MAADIYNSSHMHLMTAVHNQAEFTLNLFSHHEIREVVN